MKTAKTKKKNYPLSKVYGLLETGPVVLVTTAYKDRFNIMAMSWHTMLEFEPPLIGCVISNRNDTFNMLRKTKECVINIPTKRIARKVVACGNAHGKKIDKFKAFKLNSEKARVVSAPLIAECYANLECRVINQKMVTAYNFFVLEVVKAWIDPLIQNPQTIHHQGRGIFRTCGPRFSLPSKMK